MASGCRECLAPADRSLKPGRSHDPEVDPYPVSPPRRKERKGNPGEMPTWRLGDERRLDGNGVMHLWAVISAGALRPGQLATGALGRTRE